MTRRRIAVAAAAVLTLAAQATSASLSAASASAAPNASSSSATSSSSSAASSSSSQSSSASHSDKASPASTSSWAPKGHVLGTGTHFYVVPKTVPGATTPGGTAYGNDALQQAATDQAAGDTTGAMQMRALGAYPWALWFTGGTASQSQASINADTQAAVHAVVTNAAAAHQVPVLVVYDVPGRDCSQYSAGGAQTDADYQSFIDAFAAGLGSAKAVIVVEPDALANLPDDCFGTSLTQEQATANRISDVRYAAETLEHSDGNDLVYLDAGNAAWHGVGDYGKYNTDPTNPNATTSYSFDGAATRLIMGGVNDVQGFSLNVSNYQTDAVSQDYGNWVSDCIAYINHGGNSSYCPGQYDSNGADFSASHVATVNQWYATDGVPAGTPQPHFVIDSSRNGQGPWTAPSGTIDGLAIGDPQVWCNPPGRGLGAPSTIHTGDPLNDAKIWIKTPGESDGQCNRNQPSTNPYPASDPVYDQIFNTPNFVDPAAGVFWPYYASMLVTNAVPHLAH